MEIAAIGGILPLFAGFNRDIIVAPMYAAKHCSGSREPLFDTHFSQSRMVAATSIFLFKIAATESINSYLQEEFKFTGAGEDKVVVEEQ